MRFLKNRSFILAAGLSALVGALVFAGGLFSSPAKGTGKAASSEVPSAVGCEDNSCEKVHALFRKKASEEGQKFRSQEACCPVLSPLGPPEGTAAFPSPAVPAPAAVGIE